MTKWASALSLLCRAGIVLLSISFVTPGERASEEGAPKGFDVVLFYNADELAGGHDVEFVVKVENETAEPVEVVYGPLSTDVLDSPFEKLESKRPWTLKLVVDIEEGDDKHLDFSGKVEVARADVPGTGHALVLFTPSDKHLPGKRLRVWAELRSPGWTKVYRSNEVTLHRDTQPKGPAI